VVAAAIAIAIVTFSSGIVGAADDGVPTVTVDDTGSKAGETIIVSGTGWAGSDLIYLELCGNAGRNGSRSCDQGHAMLTGVAPDGSFGATLTVADPPVPCPCVVKATSQSTQAFATTPLALQGVPVVPLEDQTVMTQQVRSVDITEARITGRDSWRSWLGAGARRVLVLTVANDGDVAVQDPPVTVRIGKGASPDGIVRAPELGTIEPGQSATVEVPLRLGPLGFGEHTAAVSISGFAEPVAARASTSTYPWGLLALAAIAVQLVLLGLRNAARRRIEGAALWDDAEAAEISSELVRTMALTGAGAAEAGGDPDIVGREVALSSSASEPQGGAVTAFLPQDEPAAPEPDDGEHRRPTDDPLIADWLLLGAATDPEVLVDDPPAVERTELPVAAPSEADSSEPAEDAAAAGVPVAAPSERDPGEPAEGVSAAGAPPAPVAPSPSEPGAGTTRRSEAVGVSTNGHRDATSSNVRLVGGTAWIGAERHSAAEALEEAKVLSSSIVDVATRRADAIVQQAMAMRAGAAAVLDEARVTVEHLINVALVSAEAIRQDAEQQREAASRAAQDARQEIRQLVTEATTLLEERLAAVALQAAMVLADEPPPDQVIDLDDRDAPTTADQPVIELDTWDATPPRITNALDSAIERAVQRALQG
jgi:hypothetical protein